MQDVCHIIIYEPSIWPYLLTALHAGWHIRVWRGSDFKADRLLLQLDLNQKTCVELLLIFYFSPNNGKNSHVYGCGVLTKILNCFFQMWVSFLHTSVQNHTSPLPDWFIFRFLFLQILLPLANHKVKSSEPSGPLLLELILVSAA